MQTQLHELCTKAEALVGAFSNVTKVSFQLYTLDITCLLVAQARQAMVLQQLSLTPRLHSSEQILQRSFSGTSGIVAAVYLKNGEWNGNGKAVFSVFEGVKK